MSQLHRKPLVELISPIASQNEIQIGNRTKIHALLVFSIKLDKIKRKENFFQTPESWSQEKKGCIPAYSPWDSSSSASSSLSLRGSWSLKENFPERSRLQKAFLQKIYFPAPRERESHENKLLLDSHGSFFRSKQKLQHTQLRNQTKEISTQMNFFIATINFDYK